MNEEAHWNRIAPSYEDEIFDVFKSDKKKKLPVYFKKYANRSHRAIDFGCGIGKAFPFLAPLFGRILAIDISSECLAIAKTRPYSNIDFQRADLTRRNLQLPKVDFAFCCNVVMLPEIDKNEWMIRNIQKSLKAGGSAIVVMPSLESIYYSSWRLIDWYRKEGTLPQNIPVTEFNYFKGRKRDILQGIVEISGVPTKHFSEPEISILFESVGLSIISVNRLEYDWNTEFSSPPSWMKEPYPWDWLVECRKK